VPSICLNEKRVMPNTSKIDAQPRMKAMTILPEIDLLYFFIEKLSDITQPV